MTTETPMAVEINCETGEEVIRPLTTEEIVQRNLDAERYAAEKAASEASAQAKDALKTAALAKLTALGLTEEEANAISGA